LGSLVDEARATEARLKRDAILLGKKHLAELRREATQKLLNGVLALAAKLAADEPGKGDSSHG